MTKPRIRTIKIATVLAVAFVAGVVAQDLWDDESLFAEEELVVDASVTGTLPEGESGSDDELFDALFGGGGDPADLASDGEDLASEEDLGDLSPVDAVAEDNVDAFESVEAPAAIPEDLFEGSVDTGAAAADEAFAEAGSTNGWDADALLDDMLTTGDQDGAVAETMEDAGLGDLFAGELDAGGVAAEAVVEDAGEDEDLDALFGTLIAEEPVAPVEEPPVETQEVVAAVEEPVPDGEDAGLGDLFAGELDAGEETAEAVVEDAGEDEDLDALFGTLIAEEPVAPVEPPVETQEVVAAVEEPVPDKGDPVADLDPADAGDDIDFDALFDDLATGTEPEPVAEVEPERRARTGGRGRAGGRSGSRRCW